MVNILSVSDVERDMINKEKIKYDLMISCGDLSPGYIDYLICEFNPLFTVIVHGNHDKRYYKNVYKEKNYSFSEIYKGAFILNEGIIDLREYIKKDLIIAGFSGAMSYGNRPFHFREKDVTSFKRKVLTEKWFRKRKLDIIATHNPPTYKDLISDFDSYHKGSENFGKIYDKIFPSLWLYGHIHKEYKYNLTDYKIKRKSESSYVFNSVPYIKIKYDEEQKKVVDFKGHRVIFKEYCENFGR